MDIKTQIALNRKIDNIGRKILYEAPSTICISEDDKKDILQEAKIELFRLLDEELQSFYDVKDTRNLDIIRKVIKNCRVHFIRRNKNDGVKYVPIGSSINHDSFDATNGSVSDFYVAADGSAETYDMYDTTCPESDVRFEAIDENKFNIDRVQWSTRNPEQVLMEAERRSAMKQSFKTGVDMLPEKHRNIFNLHHTESLTQQEIADMLGVSQQYVHQIIRESVIMIKQTIKDS